MFTLLQTLIVLLICSSCLNGFLFYRRKIFRKKLAQFALDITRARATLPIQAYDHWLSEKVKELWTGDIFASV